jgi:hypothetical protein
MLWDGDDDDNDGPRGQPGTAPRSPLYEGTGAHDADDGSELSREGPPLEPKQQAAAYIHDAIAYLRSLSSFGAHLDDEVRRDFNARAFGCTQKLRRALAVLHADNPVSDDDD